MKHTVFLDLALDEAKKAGEDGAMPVGAVIVSSDGQVLARGRNRVLSTGDQTAHAEVDAIRNAGPALAPLMPGAIPRVDPERAFTLYSSAQPCLMCWGAILFSSISTLVWAAPSTTGDAYTALLSTSYQTERLKSIRLVAEPSPHHRAQSRALLRAFFVKHGNLHLARFVSDLEEPSS